MQQHFFAAWKWDVQDTQELWQTSIRNLYVWLCKNYKEQPEKAQELMNFLGAASMVECQVYPVNSKYHMNLVGVPMTLQSRRQDYKLLTGSKKLEIEEFCAITETFRKSFFGK